MIAWFKYIRDLIKVEFHIWKSLCNCIEWDDEEAHGKVELSFRKDNKMIRHVYCNCGYLKKDYDCPIEFKKVRIF